MSKTDEKVIGENGCTCRSEQYTFGGKVYIWRDKNCPVHSLKQEGPVESQAGEGERK